MALFLGVLFVINLVILGIISIRFLNLIIISIFHYLVVIILFSGRLFSLLFFMLTSFTVVCTLVFSIFSLLNRKLMEELLLIL